MYGLRRDALFTLLRHRGLLVTPKRNYAKTTNAHHRFHYQSNLVNEAPKPDERETPFSEGDYK